MVTISSRDSIFELVTKYPELKDALFELGFVDIVKPGMLQTAGRFMNLEKGSKLKGIPLTTIKEKLYEKGFELKEA
ncbi:MAG: DUF1858 domain-containing protein [Clostridiales bacterium]|nr:DUF1858 domain-containing protein [Clostridiales bacterium]